MIHLVKNKIFAGGGRQRKPRGGERTSFQKGKTTSVRCKKSIRGRRRNKTSYKKKGDEPFQPNEKKGEKKRSVMRFSLKGESQPRLHHRKKRENRKN